MEYKKKAASHREAAKKLAFPQSSIVGTIGELARQFARGTEVPEEFYFIAGISMLGAVCSPDLTLKVGAEVDTRFYTILLGESYSVKKSTALRNTMDFFSKLAAVPKPHIIQGVGSAEGLARELANNPKLVIAYDEMRAFVDKTKVQSSVLLPMTTSLFEGHDWSNSTKDKQTCFQVQNAHLSIIGCCTTDTYETMWSSEAIAIGFPNRLLIVNAEANPKVAWPEPPDQEALLDIGGRIQRQVARLPLKFEVDAIGRSAWEDWYYNLPSSEHVKRLDTIGWRLLPLFALTSDKDSIDSATVRRVTDVLDYELRLRMLTDPIDADGKIARLEEKIRRVLRTKGPQSNRDLRRMVHADREGIWAYGQAIKNLVKAGDIIPGDSGFAIAEQSDATAASPDSSPPPGGTQVLSFVRDGAFIS
jgi:hypothetical protein